MQRSVCCFLTSSVLLAAPQGPTGPLPASHLIDSLVIVSPSLAANPMPLPGVFGLLRVDLQSAIIASFDENSGSIVDHLEELPGADQFFFQVARLDEQGFSLSHVRRIGTDHELRFAQVEPELVARNRAEQCILQATDTEMSEWTGTPQIVGVRRLFRPDVQGVAYFEFAVGQGGFVIVATGDHDVPIPNWSSVGMPPTMVLQQATPGETIERFYKLDSMTLVGENAAVQRIATLGELPHQMEGVPAMLDEQTAEFQPLLRRWPSWRAMKVGYSETYRPYLRQNHLRAQERWNIENDPVDASWSSWTTYSADGGSSDQPVYSQFTYGSCAVGCGPVAWAMLFAWGDYQAHAGNPDWSGRTGLYRTNGGTTASGASSSAVAPLTQTTGIVNIIEELNDWVDTYCLFGSGATWPSHMDDAQGYLDARTGAYCTATSSDTFIATSQKRDDARDSIKDRDTPVIIGTSMGGGLHYPLAFKYRWRSKTSWLGVTTYDREFYVNPGWGSSSLFQWIDAKTWFVGQLYP